MDLDAPATYTGFDPSGMFARLREFPQQCLTAWETGMAFSLPEMGAVRRVVLLGMGGSAIAGDLLRTIADHDGRVSVVVQREYVLPPAVDRETLVIASSYSGATEETLSAFEAALQTPAAKLVLTGGGPLLHLAREHGVAALPIRYVAPPRAALPHSFFPLLALFQRLGFIADKTAALAETAEVLAELVGDIDQAVPTVRNAAKQLARRLFGHLPVLYAGTPLVEAAHRWKMQFNENAKCWAMYEPLPEADHNAVVGFGLPPSVADSAYVLFLRGTSLSPRLRLRYEATQELLAEADVAYETVEARGESLLAQLMSLILLGDYISCYLALIHGRDPWPVPPIDRLKERLLGT